MIIVASFTGALIFATIGGMLFTDGSKSVQNELTQLCWAFVGVIVGIVTFSQLGFI